MSELSVGMNIRIRDFLKKRGKTICFVAILGLVLYHSFYLENLDNRKTTLSNQTFNVEEYVWDFWRKLLPKQDKVPAATEILSVLHRDIPGAIRQYATQTKDVSSTHFFLLKGCGKAVVVTPEGVSLSLEDADGKVVGKVGVGAASEVEGEIGGERRIILVTDLIFGNTVRNASGLVDSDQFPDSMDYNRVSEAINAKIMNDVIPVFRDEVKKGSMVVFFGAAQVFENDPQIRPWKVIPIQVEVKSLNDGSSE